MSVVFFLQNMDLREHQSGLNMPQFSFIWTYFDDKYWCDSWIKIPFKEYLKRKKKVSILSLFIHRVVNVWSPPIPQTLLTQPNSSTRSREGVRKGGSTYGHVEPLWPSFSCWPGKGILYFLRWLEMDWGWRSSLRLKGRTSVCFRSTCPTSMHSACRKHFKRTF